MERSFKKRFNMASNYILYKLILKIKGLMYLPVLSNLPPAYIKANLFFFLNYLLIIKSENSKKIIKIKIIT